MRALTADRRAYTSIVFALFAAVLTIGMLSATKGIKNTMVAAINKQAPIRY